MTRKARQSRCAQMPRMGKLRTAEEAKGRRGLLLLWRGRLVLRLGACATLPTWVYARRHCSADLLLLSSHAHACMCLSHVLEAIRGGGPAEASRSSAGGAARAPPKKLKGAASLSSALAAGAFSSGLEPTQASPIAVKPSTAFHVLPSCPLKATHVSCSFVHRFTHANACAGSVLTNPLSASLLAEGE